MWPSGAMKRTPDLPQVLAQSKTGEAEGAEEAEAGIGLGLGRVDAEAVERLVAEAPGVEGEADLEDAAE